MPTAAAPSTRARCAQCATLMQSIVRCPKPVIAAVQGTATAAGCQLVATCDLAVAAREREVLPRPASTSGCSARRPWWRCRATCRASAPWRCCCWARCCPPQSGRRVRPRQSRGAGRQGAWTRRWRMARQIAVQAAATRRHRQGGVLPADRDAARRGLRLCRRRHGREHDARATPRKASAPSSRSAPPDWTGR